MRLTIFDVEHGACALLTADSGIHALIDCGHNSTTSWRPSTELPRLGVRQIDRLFVTNFDEDHVSDLVRLRQALPINSLWKNPTVSPPQLLALKSEDCLPGPGMDSLIQMSTQYNGPVSASDWGQISFSYYWNRYPEDFDDENNLSMALFVRHPQMKVLFPGDLEKAGWRKLLANNAFVADLLGTDVLVASHHGRANGCCEELFASTGWRPTIVVISDGVKQYATQETIPWYRARSTGINFFGDPRHVFTTRRDGHIFLSAGIFGGNIDTSARQLRLLAG